MELWMLFVVIAIIAGVVEIIAPTLFCINFAIAALITTVVSIFWGGFIENMIVFIVLSVLSIVFIKPLLEKLLKKEDETDFAAQYIGKVAKVVEPISDTKGAVTIYEERWEARLKEAGEEIPAETIVKIVSNDSTILFVEKI